MPITVSEAMKIDRLNNFKLLAGKWGLDNSIEKVGILDYEIISKNYGQFGKGDFVISRFLSAKDDVNLLREAVVSLIADGVSGGLLQQK